MTKLTVNSKTLTPSTNVYGESQQITLKVGETPRGLQGLQGIQGEKGDKGDRGDSATLKGDKGDKGEKGDQGIQGKQGIQGVKGDTGAKGDKGDIGLTGETGSGLNVIDSLASTSELPPTGSVGDAYLINGDLHIWSPSATAFVNTGRIKGVKGDKGDRGIQGERGIKGDKGDIGLTGPEGASPGVDVLNKIKILALAGL